MNPIAFLLRPMAVVSLCLWLLLGYGSNCVVGQPTTDGGEPPLIDYSITRNYEIGGITVSGTRYVDENVLISLSGLSVGEKIAIPGDDIPQAIKGLWKQGLFSDVKIYATRIVNDIIFLEIKLAERPRLSKYSFDGARKGEEEDLRDQLSLVRGRIVTESLLNQTQNTVEDFYRKKGFWNAQIEILQYPDADIPNSIVMDINVRRGEKVRIGEISINGNENVLSRKLKKQMKDTKERAKLYPDAPIRVWKSLKKANVVETLSNLTLPEMAQYVDDHLFKFKLFSSSKFLEDNYETDKKALIEHYNDLGFRDAQITRDTFYLANDNTIRIEVDIDEGRQYYFRNIEWKGNTKYDSDFLSRVLGIKKGDIYSQSTLRSRLFIDPNSSDISSLYMDDGYLFFQITPEEKAVEGDSIDLVINMSEGPQATIDKIIIRGNDKTNEHVIRRELRSLPGNKFSRSDIIRSQRELASLGYFDPEQIQINPVPNPDKGTVDIEYTVAERSNDQLELSAGWGGRNANGNPTFVGTIGVAFNNFSLRNITKKEAWRPLPSGDGQRLSFRFQSTGAPFQSLNLSFTEPWLGGKRPNALTTTAYTTRQYYATGSGASKKDHQFYTIGASIELSRRLRFPDDNFIMRNSIDYQHYRLLDWGQDFVIRNGTSNNLSFTTTIARTSLDQPLFPRSGSNIIFTLQITPPYSKWFNRNVDYSEATDDVKYKWIEYHKWKFKAEWFTPIIGKLVLRASAKCGMMGYYNSGIGQSPFQRFQVGGDGIANFNLYGREIIALRGYEEGDVMGSASNTGRPYYAKYTLELRYPLSLNPNSTIYAQAFVEGGNAWNTFRSFNPFEVKRSAGIGMRIYLPMFGLLGFDYGVGFDKVRDVTGGLGNYLSEKGRFSVVLGFEPE